MKKNIKMHNNKQIRANTHSYSHILLALTLRIRRIFFVFDSVSSLSPFSYVKTHEVCESSTFCCDVLLFHYCCHCCSYLWTDTSVKMIRALQRIKWNKERKSKAKPRWQMQKKKLVKEWKKNTEMKKKPNGI